MISGHLPFVVIETHLSIVPPLILFFVQSIPEVNLVLAVLYQKADAVPLLPLLEGFPVPDSNFILDMVLRCVLVLKLSDQLGDLLAVSQLQRRWYLQTAGSDSWTFGVFVLLGFFHGRWDLLLEPRSSVGDFAFKERLVNVRPLDLLGSEVVVLEARRSQVWVENHGVVATSWVLYCNLREIPLLHGHTRAVLVVIRTCLTCEGLKRLVVLAGTQAQLQI